MQPSSRRAFQRAPKVTLGWCFGRERENQPNFGGAFLAVQHGHSHRRSQCRQKPTSLVAGWRPWASGGEAAPGEGSPREGDAHLGTYSQRHHPWVPPNLGGIQPLCWELAHCGQ